MSPNSQTQLWCLHGNFGLPQDWRDLQSKAKQFGAGFELRIPNLWDDTALSSADRPIAWAERFVKRVQNESSLPAVLVGYSMGGRLALQALVTKPALWKAVVLISSHPCDLDSDEREARLNVDRGWAESLRDQSTPWDQIMSRWNAQPIFAGSGEAPRRHEQSFIREKLAAGFEAWSLAHMNASLADAAACRVPLMWLIGARDKALIKHAVHWRAQLPPHVKVHAIDAGHRVPWDAPESLVGTLQEYLAAQTT